MGNMGHEPTIAVFESDVIARSDDRNQKLSADPLLSIPQWCAWPVRTDDVGDAIAE